MEGITLQFADTKNGGPHASWEDIHITDGSGTTFCGKENVTKTFREADWDTLHGFSCGAIDFEHPCRHVCKKCYGTAVLRLRPKAQFWFLSPFDGRMNTFKSLAAAVKAARKEHGNTTINQTGPGDVNRIAKFVEGLPALP